MLCIGYGEASRTGEGSVSADRDPSSGALRAPPSPTRGEGREEPGDDKLKYDAPEDSYSPACSLRGSGNNSAAPGLTSRGASTGSALLKSSSSMRPARFSILSAEIR